MKQENEKEALFRKFIANRCTPEEIEQVLEYLGSRDADTTVHGLIAQQLQLSALSNEAMDARMAALIRGRIASRIQKAPPLTGRAAIPPAPAPHSPAAITPADVQLPPTSPTPVPPAANSRSPWKSWKIAAVFAGIFILAGTAYYRLFMYSPWIVKETSYGEIARIILPDSSQVILNSNSSIRYSPGWNEHESREVWIDGEVFFSVRHMQDDQKFIVHPSTNFDVEVLGTEFTVYNRGNASRVVLNSGKVQLKIRGKNRTERVDMQPGELVALEEKSGKYEKHKVDPELYTSWVDGKIVLDNTSFREISVLLQETYGISVAVPDSALYTERFTGAIPSDNIQSLLNALALAFDFEMEKEGDKVIFKTRSH